jgi:hypothetical protein
MLDDAKDQPTSELVKKRNMLKGMRMRDEFMCPITYSLMRDPVVASDGNTYEKGAIEKWLKTNHTSPRTGEPMDTLLIPNLNMKRLIQDIMIEGGEGFYTKDITNRERIFEFTPEKILVLECLGPPESDWNQQSFEVTGNGCIGGRKHVIDEGTGMKEMVLFKDITVSRRHFEITQALDVTSKCKHFFIRDLGSAGGTFIRIMYGTKKQLHPGMIILLGKHQFTVSSIDDSGAVLDNNSSSAKGPAGNMTAGGSGGGGAKATTGISSSGKVIPQDMIKSVVENAEKIIKDMHDGSNDNLEDQLRNLHLGLRNACGEVEAAAAAAAASAIVASGMEEGTSASAAAAADDKEYFNPHIRSLQDKHHHHHHHHHHHRVLDNIDNNNNNNNYDDPDFALVRSGPLGETINGNNSLDAKHSYMLPNAEPMPTPSKSGKGFGFHNTHHVSEGKDMLDELMLPVATAVDYTHRRCTLTCCAPDGSPLQGKSFIVTPDGAMMGRKQTNAIALLMKVTDATGEERIANVDTAISSEHARVEFEADTGRFYICDGTPMKASTNGTWFRLSGPHQESPPHLLQSGTEVLIGTVRFQVRESMTISERKVDSNDDNK